MKPLLKLISIVTLILLIACSSNLVDNPYDFSNMDRTTRIAYLSVHTFLQRGIKDGEPVQLNKYSKIDTIIIK